MAVAPSASYSLTVPLEIKNRPGMLGRVASAIGETGGDIGAVDLVESQRDRVVRDITIKARDSVHGQQIVNRLRQVPGIRITNVSDRTLLIGLSVPGILTVRDIKRLAQDPIVFAMANPTPPEIQPEDAEKHARVMATGRSDYPNQINNVPCFPGFFRGLLDSRARTVNDEMKLGAARALAAAVTPSELSAEYIIPSVFNKAVAPAVAGGEARTAHRTGVARRRRRREVAPVW